MILLKFVCAFGATYKIVFIRMLSKKMVWGKKIINDILVNDKFRHIILNFKQFNRIEFSYKCVEKRL